MKPLSVSATIRRSGVSLSVGERDLLVRAIESAIEVSRLDQFHAWLSGPFRDFLPHELFVCVELQVDGGARVIESLYCGRLGAGAADRISIGVQGVAMSLACVYRNDRRQSCTVTADDMAAMQGRGATPAGVQELRNAAIHRITLLSGAAYRCLLFNLPQDQLERCRFRFQLVTAHLKMALSCALPPPQRCDASLTAREREVLQWMIQGKSNREISRLVGISAITLKNHISKLYRKLDVQSRNEAVARGRATVISCTVESQ